MIGPQTATLRPWIAFACAAVWVVLIRVPLIVNASNHLDSDLAVDGITLLEATQGHLRWHYPGTPFTGIGAVLLSLPPALIWGANSRTLVSGGMLAHLGLLAAGFWLAWRTAGPGVAAWSLVPLTFVSTGVLWLSARITGGHLVAAAWHAGAFALLAGLLMNGGRLRAVTLGLWCGFGLYLDAMLSITVIGLIAAAGLNGIFAKTPRQSIVAALFFTLGFFGGVWPRPLGVWIDPYDAYRDQFALSFQPALLNNHARILLKECLPRLIAGYTLPGLESEPDPTTLSGSTSTRRRTPFSLLSAAVVVITLTVAIASVFALASTAFHGPSRTLRVVLGGLLLSATATFAGFLVNRNIFNSDNYRYLVGLLAPLSLGFGFFAEGCYRKGLRWRVGMVASVVLFAGLMTADTFRWYAQFGWIERSGLPVVKPMDDPTFDWLKAHPEVSWIEAGYWDVYRLAFLTGGKVRGAPFPTYPNRFPEWRRTSDPVILVRLNPEGVTFRNQAIRDGYRSVQRARGVTILRRVPAKAAR